MCGDGVVCGSGHGQQPRGRVRQIEPIDVELQGDGPHVGVEVESAVIGATQPAGHVFGVGHGRTQGNDSNGFVNLKWLGRKLYGAYSIPIKGKPAQQKSFSR